MNMGYESHWNWLIRTSLLLKFTFDVLPIIRGSHNFKIGSGDPGHAHFGVILRFIRRKDPSVLHLCTKFEADSSICSRQLYSSQNWVTWPRSRPRMGRFMVHTQEQPSYTSVLNLKRIAQFVQKLLRGSQNLEIRSCGPGHAHLGVVI